MTVLGLAPPLAVSWRVGWQRWSSYGEGSSSSLLSAITSAPVFSAQGLETLSGMAVQFLHTGWPGGWKEDVSLLVPWCTVVYTQLTLDVQVGNRHCLLLGVQRAEDALHATKLALQRPDAAVSKLDIALELLEEAASMPGHVRELPEDPGQRSVADRAKV